MPDITITLTPDEAVALADSVRVEQWGYGYYPGGGDPRDFSPDRELCSPEEIAAWEADCAAWEAGNGQPAPPSCYTNESGTLHILAPRYGIGSYRYADPDAQSALDKLAAAVRAAQGERHATTP